MSVNRPQAVAAYTRDLVYARLAPGILKELEREIPSMSAAGVGVSRRADLLAQVEHLDGLAKTPTWGADVRAEIRRRLEDWRGLLGREPEVARQILRKLIDGRLTMTPKVTSDGRFYEITSRATYGRLFEGVVVNMVPPG